MFVQCRSVLTITHFCNLNLTGPPKIVSFGPNPVNATENKPTQMECRGTGTPVPNFKVKKLAPAPGDLLIRYICRDFTAQKLFPKSMLLMRFLLIFTFYTYSFISLFNPLTTSSGEEDNNEEPFISFLSCLLSLGGDVGLLTSTNPIRGTLKNPQQFSKRVGESHRCWRPVLYQMH